MTCDHPAACRVEVAFFGVAAEICSLCGGVTEREARMSEKEWTTEELGRAVAGLTNQWLDVVTLREVGKAAALKLGLKLRPELPKRSGWREGIGFTDDNGKPLLGADWDLVRPELLRRYRAIGEALEFASAHLAWKSTAAVELIRILREGGR